MNKLHLILIPEEYKLEKNCKEYEARYLKNQQIEQIEKIIKKK
jgi:hypothetical protein